MSDILGVGIIGVNATRGWARISHVPAVQGLRGLRLTAVGTRSDRSAQQAAAAFGVDRSYGDPLALIAAPEVDIVGVAASVPAHRELILAAIDNGKHVVTEWPVGLDSEQNVEIAKAVTGDVHVAVGLQARLNPATIEARRLVSTGAIGRVLYATVYSSTMAFGASLPQDAVALEDPATGMNLTTIQLAHTVDLSTALIGPLTELAAQFTTQYPHPQVQTTGERLSRVTPDHVLVQGRVEGGAALTVQVAGGRPPEDTPFRLEIQGERGTLVLLGGAPRGFQSGLLRLELNGDPVVLEPAETDSLPAEAVNVAGVYAALRDDVRDGTTSAPSLPDAVRLSLLIDDIRRAATGKAVVRASGLVL